MSKTTPRLLALAGLLALIAPSAVFAQGVLIDVRPDHRWRMPRPIIRPRPLPPTSYKIKEIAVNATVNDQVAKVQVSQTFVNTGSRQMEVCFVFPLPYDGAVDQLTLMVDGKEYEAKLLDAKKARSIYEEVVRRNQDPALMEWIGTGMFKTSVFPVPPGPISVTRRRRSPSAVVSRSRSMMRSSVSGEAVSGRRSVAARHLCGSRAPQSARSRRPSHHL